MSSQQPRANSPEGKGRHSAVTLAVTDKYITALVYDLQFASFPLILVSVLIFLVDINSD